MIKATDIHDFHPGDLEMITQEAKTQLVGLSPQEVAAVTLVLASIASFAIANVAELANRPAADVFEQMIARALVIKSESVKEDGEVE
ncbi:hypothetical protein [Phytoactinopolyspora mesophila]|uniref:Uncharacterized protein n=1 Tax=Phytoactinopolyspora mesophila TaxID=2650750 RepID=A0A7K3M6H6_9ACTN|nr:hypothetical protein [Phytoactinopolyspora mesophila]NDL58647.1 hypothetical protein [Phytoactinopolyspora mesophila]